MNSNGIIYYGDSFLKEREIQGGKSASTNVPRFVGFSTLKGSRGAGETITLSPQLPFSLSKVFRHG